jgi:hypothetical protein
MHRTKWEIPNARAAEMREKLERLESEIRGMENTPDNVKCSGCGEQFRVNADFARHFKIPNEQLLNTGYCPNNPR